MISRDPQELLAQARASGDDPSSKVAIARLISMIERGGQEARSVGRAAYGFAGNAYTIGITGAPGAGKSTMTDQLIGMFRADGRVGVIAIDPTSPFTGGAILGDRVRMGAHYEDAGVYIRSMATRGHLGGLAFAVPEAIRLLDAVGFETVIVETVGVGQVEVEVAGAADSTVVVVNPGWGDSVQANKAGLMEIADVFAVNKADRPGARETCRDLESMLDLANRTSDEWRPPVLTTSSITGDGIEDLYKAICDHRAYLADSGKLLQRRERRISEELQRVVLKRLEDTVQQVWDRPDVIRLRQDTEQYRIEMYEAAERIADSVLRATDCD